MSEFQHHSSSDHPSFSFFKKHWLIIAGIILLVVILIVVAFILLRPGSSHTYFELESLREEAENYLDMGQYDEAKKLYRELKIAGDEVGAMHFDVLTAFDRLQTHQTDRGLLLILSTNVPILLRVDDHEAEKIMPNSGFDGLGTPKREGYYFNFWNVKYLYYQHEESPYVELALASDWRPRSYKIDYELNGGTTGLFDAPKEYSVKYGVTLPQPTRSGYVFVGWIGTDLDQPTKNVVIPEESIGYRKYEAVWEPVKYRILLQLNGGTCDTQQIIVTYGEPFTLPTPSHESFEFRGWYYNDRKVSDSVWKYNKGIILKAKWWEYSITYIMNGGINPDSNPTGCSFGDIIDFAEPTREGYTFLGWTINDDPEIKQSLSISVGKSDIVIEAHWKSNIR